jgi:hypothetical protein
MVVEVRMERFQAPGSGQGQQRGTMSKAPQNNALHLTKGGGVPASQAVVEAPFAGERECSADLGYDEWLGRPSASA